MKKNAQSFYNLVLVIIVAVVAIVTMLNMAYNNKIQSSSNSNLILDDQNTDLTGQAFKQIVIPAISIPADSCLNKNNLEIQVLETAHKERLQKSMEDGDKALRLLDDKIKVFSDFHANYSEILMSGTDQSRMEKIEILRKSAYKVRLLVPSIAAELKVLDDELVKFANFLFEIIHNGKTFQSQGIKRSEMAVFFRNTKTATKIILDSLSDKL